MGQLISHVLMTLCSHTRLLVRAVKLTDWLID